MCSLEPPCDTVCSDPLFLLGWVCTPRSCAAPQWGRHPALASALILALLLLPKKIGWPPHIIWYWYVARFPNARSAISAGTWGKDLVSLVLVYCW